MKRLLIMAAAIFIAQYANAQSGVMKDPVSFKLKNGLTVIVAENQSAAKVFTSFVIDAVPVVEGNKPGVQEMLNLMLNDNAGQTTKDVSFDEKGGNLAALPADFDNALTTMSGSIKELDISQPLFDKAKAKLIASVKAKDHYYAETVTEAAVNELTVNDLKEFYSKNITPSRAFLTIAGNITVASAKALSKRKFGNWKTSALAIN